MGNELQFSYADSYLETCLVRKSFIILVAVALMFCGNAFAQNLVSNGGFELGSVGGVGYGDFVGWNPVDDPRSLYNTGNALTFLDDCTYGNYCAHSGTYMAEFGAVGNSSGIGQSIGTTAGPNYLVSFWLANDDGCSDQRGCFTSIDVSFGGVTLISNSLE